MSSARTYAEIRKKRIEKYLRDYGYDMKAKATAKALHTVKMTSAEKAAFRKKYIADNDVPRSKEAIAAYRQALKDERARKKVAYEQEAQEAGVDMGKIRKDVKEKYEKALERDKKLKEERDAAIQAMIEAEGYDEVAERPARPSPSSRPAPADTESKTEESDASGPGFFLVLQVMFPSLVVILVVVKAKKQEQREKKKSKLLVNWRQPKQKRRDKKN